MSRDAPNPSGDGGASAAPIVDTERLAELMELDEPGSTEFFDEVVAVFRAEGTERLTDLRTAVAAADAERVYLAAHALKGEALTCGAAALAEACRVVEQRARGGDLSGVADAIGGIERLFGASVAALEQIQAGSAG